MTYCHETPPPNTPIMHGVGGVYWILLRAKFFSGNAGSEKRHYAHKYMTCKSKKESAVLRVMLGSTLHNWTQKSEIPQVSTLMCTPGLFGLCRGCKVGLAACKQGCWLWQTLENPIIVRSFRATRRCIYYKMGGNYFWRGVLIFMPLCFHKKNQGVLMNLDKITHRFLQWYIALSFCPKFLRVF